LGKSFDVDDKFVVVKSGESLGMGINDKFVVVKSGESLGMGIDG
jgi:hypothetical protein